MVVKFNSRKLQRTEKMHGKSIQSKSLEIKHVCK